MKEDSFKIDRKTIQNQKSYDNVTSSSINSLSDTISDSEASQSSKEYISRISYGHMEFLKKRLGNLIILKKKIKNDEYSISK